jgi:hypothetical protein
MTPRGYGFGRQHPALVIVACALALVAHESLAQNRPESWTFEVIEVAPTDPEGHIIRLRPSPSGRRFPRSCENFILYAIYDTSSWSDSGREKVERAGHDRAIRKLEQAIVTRDIVRLGTLNRGFAAIDDKSRCEVATRALQVVIRDGQTAILSFFDEP